jgi:2-amino-4-hydroxy-6-hydroxymethyldihydropteridine diphosphokinase
MSETQRVAAYIGLGSNLGDPVAEVKNALKELAGLACTYSIRHSCLYRTHPVGPVAQPDFINAVARLETSLQPDALFDALQALERGHRRVRSAQRWGPRTLDLDLLLYDQLQIATPRLVLPHPQMTLRAFVLVPLADVAPPELVIPGSLSLGDLLRRISTQGVARLP